ncbi:hypothetical protein XELAEV_18005335mg [Xenopus laevis]|uniref:Secreted protein n=1 Tax=Xenopus laevis TaxID=8355 RepID=A0A974DX49_XENLA|nr:hypothetical protein XELAEV_18005335mg [Xenopus laevis]
MGCALRLFLLCLVWVAHSGCKRDLFGGLSAVLVLRPCCRRWFQRHPSDNGQMLRGDRYPCAWECTCCSPAVSAQSVTLLVALGSGSYTGNVGYCNGPSRTGFLETEAGLGY